MSTYLLASGDIFIIVIGIISVAYLSWARREK